MTKSEEQEGKSSLMTTENPRAREKKETSPQTAEETTDEECYTNGEVIKEKDSPQKADNSSAPTECKDGVKKLEVSEDKPADECIGDDKTEVTDDDKLPAVKMEDPRGAIVESKGIEDKRVEESEEDDGKTKNSSDLNQTALALDDDESPAMKLNDPKRAVVETPTNPIRNPNPHDVLLGRGKPFQNHSGNQQMLNIVDVYRDKYHESERAYKNEIIEEVLQNIKNCGGRFLERIDDFENSYWNEVAHSIAYRKVGHAFRSTARKPDKVQDQQRKRKAPAPPINQHIPMGHPGMSMMGGMDYNGFGGPIMAGMGPGGMGMIAMHPAMMAGFGGPMAGMGNAAMGSGGGGAGFPPTMMQSGGGLNHAQRALLAQEQLFHANRIDAIINSSNQKNGSHPSAGAGGGAISGSGDPSAANLMQGGAGMMNRFVSGPN